ncbi:MAG TPA: hypothetical protein VFB02_18375 [Bradyrhizobium sp.]|nr:hypothetical protein [Bradyrhizobium sp.]
MGLLIAGLLAGILIGFAWLAPSGHLEGCTFQWQGCFDQASTAPPFRAAALRPVPRMGETNSDVDSPAAQKLVAHSTAKHRSARAHHRVALAKAAVQPGTVGASASERQAAERPDPVLERAKLSVAAKMENPASAEFGDMDHAFRKNTLGRATDTICGHVHGKTASGGNTGERPFLYLVKEDDAYVVDGKPDSAAAIAYRNICN